MNKTLRTIIASTILSSTMSNFSAQAASAMPIDEARVKAHSEDPSTKMNGLKVLIEHTTMGTPDHTYAAGELSRMGRKPVFLY